MRRTEAEAVPVQAFPVLGQTATPVQPGDCPLNDPALRQHDELADVGPLDDLDVDLLADAVQPLLELRPLVAAVRVKFQQKWEQAEYSAHQQYAAITILDICRMDDGTQQQTLGIYQEMTLLALDFLAGIIPGRIDAGPPFSALLTL